MDVDVPRLVRRRIERLKARRTIIGVAMNVAVPMRSRPGRAMPSSASDVMINALAPVSLPCVAVMICTLPASVSTPLQPRRGLRGSSSNSCQPSRAWLIWSRPLPMAANSAGTAPSLSECPACRGPGTRDRGSRCAIVSARSSAAGPGRLARRVRARAGRYRSRDLRRARRSRIPTRSMPRRRRQRAP